MRVSTVDIDAKGLPKKIQFAPQAVDAKQNWISVVTGENGTRKSLLLRLLAGTSVGKPEFRARAYPTANLKFEEPPGKHQITIALSSTPHDRFPIISGIPLLRRPTTFDIDTYRYFGPRYAGALAGRSRACATLAYSMFCNPRCTRTRAPQVASLLKHLGYEPLVHITIAPSERLFRRGKRTSEKDIKSAINDLDNRLQQSEAHAFGELREFAATLLAGGDEFSRLIEYGDLPIDVKVDFKTGAITIQSDVAPTMQELPLLIASGLFAVRNLSFERPPNGEFPNWLRQTNTDDLSSGQWHLVDCLLNLALTVQDNSLILIDEPENSLHPEWQRGYVQLLRSCLESVTGCHAIIATHSPLIAAGVNHKEGNMLSLVATEAGAEVAATIEDTVNGWSPDDVLQQRFNLESSRSPDLVETANRTLSLLKSSGGANPAELSALGVKLRELLSTLPTTDPLVPALQAMVELATEGPQELG